MDVDRISRPQIIILTIYYHKYSGLTQLVLLGLFFLAAYFATFNLFLAILLFSILGLYFLGLPLAIWLRRGYERAILASLAEYLTLRRTLKIPFWHGLDEGPIREIAWSPDGKFLACTRGTGARGQVTSTEVQILSLKTGRVVRTLKSKGNSSAWSPDGQMLACGSQLTLYGESDGIEVCDVKTGRILRTLDGYRYCVTWSPNGLMIASASSQNSNISVQTADGTWMRKLIGHSGKVRCLAWSPDGSTLASCSGDRTIRLWDPQTGQRGRVLTGHSKGVRYLVWSPDGSTLASCSDDRTIRLWDPQTGQQTHNLEGHEGSVICLSFSCDGHLFASKSLDNTVLLWRTDTWENVLIIPDYTDKNARRCFAFHPDLPILATVRSRGIRIWDLNLQTLLRATPIAHSVHYTNAKVVVVGKSGVGKSALALVLSGQPFAPTSPTHGRQIWTFDSQEVQEGSGYKEIRETLVWDLAGQPDYHLIHQLHLTRVAVALVVFDPQNEKDPFAEVFHWTHALRQGQHNKEPVTIFLVAARVDREGRCVSQERIDAVRQAGGVDGYFETSAKEGLQIVDLAVAIKNAIDWTRLPKVTSTQIFQDIKKFLIEEKRTGQLLFPRDALYRAYLGTQNISAEREEYIDLFETCIELVEQEGFIQQLRFGNLVLLQPELLDAYASALIKAIRNEVEGMGSILEARVYVGDFPVPDEVRIPDNNVERLLLIAMVENLLRHEIALREQGEDGTYLVFPLLFTGEPPNSPSVEDMPLIFDFEGPVQNIYATLVVRLSHSGLFRKKVLGRNGATYAAKVGGVCGMFLHLKEEGRGELALFFEQAVSEETRFIFEDYVNTHLQRWASPGSLSRRHILACSNCRFVVSDDLIQLRRERGFNWLNCPACEQRIPFLDREERLTMAYSRQITNMDEAADKQREKDASKVVLLARRQVFVSYSHKDAEWLERLRVHLKPLERQGMIDLWDDTKISAGKVWREEIQSAIELSTIAVVLVSADFLASDFIAEYELPKLLQRAGTGGTTILPLIVAPCLFRGSGLDIFQAVNPLDRPIVEMTPPERERMFVKLAENISKKLAI